MNCACILSCYAVSSSPCATVLVFLLAAPSPSSVSTTAGRTEDFHIVSYNLNTRILCVMTTYLPRHELVHYFFSELTAHINSVPITVQQYSVNSCDEPANSSKQKIFYNTLQKIFPKADVGNSNIYSQQWTYYYRWQALANVIMNLWVP
jgi:hypothetical protein